LFSGTDQLDQMKKLVEMRGMPPVEMITRAKLEVCERFFDTGAAADGSPRYALKGKAASEKMAAGDENVPAPARNLDATLSEAQTRRGSEPGHTQEHYRLFVDLIDRMLDYDPETRLTPCEALKHSFFTWSPHEHKSKCKEQTKDGKEEAAAGTPGNNSAVASETGGITATSTAALAPPAPAS
jgi:serine/threonine protein kinase